RSVGARWFGELVNYVGAHGHANPPQSMYTSSGLALGRWVSAQRRPTAATRWPRTTPAGSPAWRACRPGVEPVRRAVGERL
ncbi:MAG: helicase associated domain-containing protein, partial [Mycolicibacterium sp.]|nr:helicase associated domain-containing protein [Mycolicibacterium sp.]